MRPLPRALLLFVFLSVPAGLLAQQLQCQPCSVGFGLTPIGSSKTYYIRLSNAGSKPLTINADSMSNPVFSFGNFPLPIVLGPGSLVKLPLVFAPVASGRFNGTATIKSNALNPTLTIALTGRGYGTNETQLGASPSSLNFGNVTVGSNATLQLSLSAINGDVTLTAAQTDNAEFTIPNLTLPVTIPSGQNLSVAVQFTPSVAGQASGHLTIQSSATNSPTSEPLTGTGVAAQSHEADLTWDSSNGAVGYNVYRGGTHGGPYSKINTSLDSSTNYSDANVSGGATYYYVATAVDSNGDESSYSNEAKVVIPSP